jgi:hypothetical protein
MECGILNNLFMNIDVEIYMSNLIKFFKDNPNDLINLIPISKRDEFFDKVKIVANSNAKEHKDPTLTKDQFLSVCKNIMDEDHPLIIKKSGPLIYTKFGLMSLN